MTSQPSWTGAVLSGFRLIGRRPGAAACWALAFFLADTAQVAVRRWSIGAAPADFSAIAMRSTLSSLALTLVFSVGVAVAILRAGAGPEARRPGLAAFGADMLRLSVLALPVIVVLYVGSGIALGLMLSLPQDGVSSATLFTLLGAGVKMGLVLLGARLALAGPMTIADGRIRLAAAVKLTRGRYGPVVTVLIAAVVVATLLELGGDFMRAQLTHASDFAPSSGGNGGDEIVVTATADTGLSLASMLLRLFGSAVRALVLAVQLAPLAYLHRRLTGDRVADQAAVFD